MKNIYLYIFLFVSGGAILTIEILGTRILGPHYGVSLYLWSALISVTLISLSAGYFLGGVLADRKNDFSIMCYIMAIAGCWLFVIPVFKNISLDLTSFLGLRLSILFTSALIFSFPLTLLGMLTPYAVKLEVESLKKVGGITGRLYAVSTIGSVVSALLSGFIFIPVMGIELLLFASGGLLILTSVVGLLSKKKSAAVVFLIVLFPLTFLGLNIYPGQNIDDNIIEIRTSAYAEIKITDDRYGRFMLIDESVHSYKEHNSNASLLPYVHVLETIQNLFAEPGKMLLVGVGGGSIIKSFRNANWKIDAVEIDPVVTELAIKYFDIEHSDAIIFEQDGRNFINSTETKYDLVILDAFGSSSIPFHLITKEAFGEIKNILKDGGILALNIESIGWYSELIKALTATLQKNFLQITTLPIEEPPVRPGNIILLASQRVLSFVKPLDRSFDRYDNNYTKNHAWNNQYLIDCTEEQIITDDLNPVDIWAEEINFETRKIYKKMLQKH